MGGVSKNLGDVTKNIAPIVKGLNLSPILEQAMGQIAQAGDQRAAFSAVLLATAANVAKKPNFNIELEINDLWIRLGNLRSASAQSASPLAQAARQMGQMTQVHNVLSTLARDVDSAMLNVLKNFR